MREKINLMIYDGGPYAKIIAQLGEAGKGLRHQNLSTWKAGGYREWLQEEQRSEGVRAKEQFAVNLLREQDGSKLHETSLQLAANQLCQFLADFDPATLREKIQADPQNFVRLLAVLPKLSESGLKCESHRVDLAERKAKLEKQKSARPPGLSDETRRYIERELNLM